MKKAKDQPGSEPAELASLVGERIRKIRKEEGLSLELFALRCDMNAAALQYFSQITRDLSPEQFHRLLNTIKEIVAECWVSVKQFSRNDTATALSGLVTSTRLGRGSIKSHVCTVKVLGMGLFAFQERVRLWQGVTH